MNFKNSVLVSCMQSDSIRNQEIQMIFDQFIQDEIGMGVTFSIIIRGTKKSVHLDKGVARSFLQDCLKQFDNE